MNTVAVHNNMSMFQMGLRKKKKFQPCSSRKTTLYNFDPPKPHFYIVKLGFTGVYIIFLFFFLLKDIDYGYLLEPPNGSNK